MGPQDGDLGVVELAESSADSEPAGQVEAGLGPGEYPGDRPQVREARLPGAAGRPGTDPGVFEGIERRGLAVELEEAVRFEQLPVGLPGFGRQAFQGGTSSAGNGAASRCRHAVAVTPASSNSR